MRAATGLIIGLCVARYISIHAAHAGCDIPKNPLIDYDTGISIHAAHAGCDVAYCISVAKNVHFNPRSPCGLRPYQQGINKLWSKFQSTQPMRAATLALPDSIMTNIFQSTQPMRAATVVPLTWVIVLMLFQSTQPMRAATSSSNYCSSWWLISIHAAHAGCD